METKLRYFRLESGSDVTAIDVDLPGHDFEVEFDAEKVLEYETFPTSVSKDHSAEQKSWLERAKAHKERANTLFRVQEKTAVALQEYKKAIHCLRRVPKAEVHELRTVLYVNLAACDLQLMDYAACRRHASKALKLDPRNVKALYRRSQARKYASFDLPGAEEDLRLACEITLNSDKTLLLALESMRKDRAKSSMLESSTARRMFSNNNSKPSSSS